MDKGFKHEKMRQVLKTEQEKCPSLGLAVVANQWDSVESDTESLAQERAYQQQLQMSVDQNKYTPPQKENADNLQHADGENEDANDDATEDLQVYDSLEQIAHPEARRDPTLLQTEYLDTQIMEEEGTSLLSDDAYSDLRYDPNWRTNLKGAGHFDESPQVSVEEYYQVPKEKSSQACGGRQGLVMKAGYRYIVDTGSAVVVTPHMAGSESEQPYRLHPQNGQTSHHDNHALQFRSPGGDLSRPSSIFTKNESDNTSQRGFKQMCENNCDNAAENISRAPERIEFKTHYQQDLRHAQAGPTQTEHISTSTLLSPKVLMNKKLERLTEDIVERNKITLGRNTSKCGSYVTVHALKQEIPHNENKVHETLQTASTESHEDSSDPKLRWLQKSQQLRVTQISKGKKAQRKESPNPPRQQQPPAPGVRAEWGDSLSSPLARPAAVIQQPKPQMTTSSQPLPPTIHLNINLNTSSHLLPLLQQGGQDAAINVASLHGCPHWSPASEVELAFSPGYQQTNPAKSSQMFRTGVNVQLHHRNLESSPEHWKRTTAMKWPLSCEEEHQKWSPNDVHTKQFPQNLPRTPTTTSSLGSGSYPVLPPIGNSMTGKEPELSPDQSASTAYVIHRSSSDGYLVQMEKQKQLRARLTYKAYSLKDYKQLKSDINLRGLGPDYSVIEKTAEKMKRQRLYSNVIREQNKKINRIPFLPAKDPEGSDKKVPRMKALEYAKTIAKPLVPSQPKQRQKHPSEGFTEHASYLEGLDVSQPATLEALRKRHEEEKQAVALFRKVHAV
ncbi:jhy protein homolog isoform X1 [Dicentrarchus labrax]|uniref:jhy protein homolog isoform X1 n=1 Tax=Dicentrarchus labrax TaxID=13489 RepID=UPI0021F5E0E2|nr:jhy protein homolog isoform X1 [Dicentrarchus labrax]